jgi:hypothetical protein
MEKLESPRLHCNFQGCKNIVQQKCKICESTSCQVHQTICSHTSFDRLLIPVSPNESVILSRYISSLLLNYNQLYQQKSDYFSEIIQKLSIQMHEELSKIADISSYLALMLKNLSSGTCHIHLRDKSFQYENWDFSIENFEVFPDFSSHFSSCFFIQVTKNHFVELERIKSIDSENFLQGQTDYLKTSGFQLYSHLNEISAVACGEKFCASLSFEDNNVKIWNLEKGSLQSDLVLDEKVVEMEIDFFTDSLVLGLSSNFIQVYHFPEGKLKKTLKFEDFEAIRCIKAGETRKLIGNNKCQVLVLDENYSKLALITPPNEKRPVVAIALNESGNLFAVAPASNNILIFQLSTLSLKQTLKIKANSKSLGFHFNRIVFIDEKNKISLMNVDNGLVEHQVKFDSFYACRKGEKMFVWNSGEEGLYEFEEGSGNHLVLQEFKVWNCASNFSGSVVVLVDENMRLFWRKGENLNEMPGHSSDVTLIHCSKTQLVTCSYSEVIIWSLKTLLQRKKFNLNSDIERITENEDTLILASSIETETRINLTTLEIV